jgi:hypothetical protein
MMQARNFRARFSDQCSCDFSIHCTVFPLNTASSITIQSLSITVMAHVSQSVAMILLQRVKSVSPNGFHVVTTADA